MMLLETDAILEPEAENPPEPCQVRQQPRDLAFGLDNWRHVQAGVI